jgi:hypothetical protein
VTTGGTPIRQLVTGGRPRDALLDGAVDVPRGADRISETVIVTTLCASCGGQHSITTDPTGRATVRMVLAGSVALERRELAREAPDFMTKRTAESDTRLRSSGERRLSRGLLGISNSFETADRILLGQVHTGYHSPGATTGWSDRRLRGGTRCESPGREERQCGRTT